MAKILFLDVDGVLNSAETVKANNNIADINPYKAALVERICNATGADIVLSSSWRLMDFTRDEVAKKVKPMFISQTPDKKGLTCRGCEVQEWLEHTLLKVDKYAILDDSPDFHASQHPHFFKTGWEHGLTDGITNDIIKYLNEP